MEYKEKYSYLEDLNVGQTFSSGPVTVTRENILSFAQQFDPQSFHLSDDAAKQSVFGELVASGWHTAALTMRLIVEASPPMKGGMIGRSVEKMIFPRPVRPGDQLSLTAEILEMRPSNSLPGRGIMRIKVVTKNQLNETVLEMETVVMIPRRS